MDLEQLGKKVDELLAKETKESLSDWLNNRRENFDARNMILNAITQNYTQDDVLYSNVIGIFESNELDKAFDMIRNSFLDKGHKIITDNHNLISNIYYLEFDDDINTYFYSSKYNINQLNL